MSIFYFRSDTVIWRKGKFSMTLNINSFVERIWISSPKFDIMR